MIVPREKEERKKEKTEKRKKSEICARRVKLRHVYRKGKKRERGKETWACTCSPDIDTPFLRVALHRGTFCRAAMTAEYFADWRRATIEF